MDYIHIVNVPSLTGLYSEISFDISFYWNSEAFLFFVL